MSFISDFDLNASFIIIILTIKFVIPIKIFVIIIVYVIFLGFHAYYLYFHINFMIYLTKFAIIQNFLSKFIFQLQVFIYELLTHL